MTTPTFNGLTVLLLESRRAREMASLVTAHGGRPIVAPSMREVPLETNTEAIDFADRLTRGEFDIIILLTGVGTRALVETVARVRGSKDEFVAALARTRIVARGPKPVAVLRELKLTPWAIAPEPNTWREVLAALDASAGKGIDPDLQVRHGAVVEADLPVRDAPGPLTGLNVAVQEYGASNPDLLAALEARGARVTRVPVYQWALPEDLGPLREGIRALVDGKVEVVLFTTGTQVVHLLQVAGTMGLTDAVCESLRKTVVASIGPTTSDELRQRGIRVDMEPSHPKMGLLVREAAERAQDLRKRT